jgi:hypothetical protein
MLARKIKGHAVAIHYNMPRPEGGNAERIHMAGNDALRPPLLTPLIFIKLGLRHIAGADTLARLCHRIDDAADLAARPLVQGAGLVFLQDIVII